MCLAIVVYDFCEDSWVKVVITKFIFRLDFNALIGRLLPNFKDAVKVSITYCIARTTIDMSILQLQNCAKPN